jgi:hypothetical protein
LNLYGKPCKFPWRLPCTASAATEEDQGGSIKLSGASSFLSSKVQTAQNIHEKPKRRIQQWASAALRTQRRNLVHSVPAGRTQLGSLLACRILELCTASTVCRHFRLNHKKHLKTVILYGQRTRTRRERIDEVMFNLAP